MRHRQCFVGYLNNADASREIGDFLLSINCLDVMMISKQRKFYNED